MTCRPPTIKGFIPEPTTTPKPSTPAMSANKMSDSLKARLKKCGRSYSSPALRKQPASPCVSSQALTDPVKFKRKATSDIGTPTATACNKMKKIHANTIQNDYQNPCRKLVEDFNLNTVENELADSLPGSSGEPVAMESTPVSQCSSSSEANKQPSMKDCPPSPLTKQITPTSSTGQSFLTPSSSVPKMTDSTLIKRRVALLKLVAEKEEKLRKLKMVKMYRTKNNLEELDQLIAKWRTICQEAIVRLQTLAQDPKPSISDLLSHLRVDPHMVGYSEEDETFT